MIQIETISRDIHVVYKDKKQVAVVIDDNLKISSVLSFSSADLETILKYMKL